MTQQFIIRSPFHCLHSARQLILVGASLLVAAVLALPAKAETSLPSSIGDRLIALFSEKGEEQGLCINSEALTNLASSNRDYAVEITLAAAQLIQTEAPSVDARIASAADPGDQTDQTRDGTDRGCACLGDIAGTVSAINPNRASKIYQALSSTSPDCSASIAKSMEQALLRRPAGASGSGSPAVSSAPGLPGFCGGTDNCSPKLPPADPRVVSPTRLGNRG